MQQWQETDPDGPSEADIARFSSEYKTCPSCREEVYDQAEFCTACNHAFMPQDEAKGLPLWVFITAGFLLLSLIAVGFAI